jgi:anaerobic selenocysteine-containing dehydrogenase
MGPGVAMHPRGTYSGDGRACAQRPAGLHRHRRRRLAKQQRAHGQVPSADKYVDDLAKTASKGKKLDGRGAKDMPAMMNAKPGSGVVTNNVANGMLKDPGAVKVFLSSWSNFNFSCTGADRWDRAMAKVPFFVHMVTNPSEMTQFADIVLPSTFNSAEGWSIVGNMGNGHGYVSIQQAAVKRLWDVKQEETEVMWLLAEKLKAKGFPNLFDYYANEFKDPETGKAPTTALEFSEIATKITSSAIWKAKEPLKGDAAITSWADFKAKGMFSGPKYTLKKGWGGKFATATKKFEFYSETLKKGLVEHAEEAQDHDRRHPGRQRLRGARRQGLRAALRSRPSATAARPTIPSPSSTTSRA